MDATKISFGFKKSIKKPNLLAPKAAKDDAKVEMIQCLEGREIKLVEEKQEEAPLVIRMKTTDNPISRLKSSLNTEGKASGSDAPADDISLVSIEKRAEYEILNEINGKPDAISDNLAAIAQSKVTAVEGAKESTLDDYEAIPIEQFGQAMLRGMGWVAPPSTNGDKTNENNLPPVLRPKGMGLGADKAIKPGALLVQPEAREVLEIKKNAFVRILGGKHKGLYGQIEGFDEHASRVIIRMAIGGAKESFNEFLCQPVAREEYSKYGKCINSEKYEMYKKLQTKHGHTMKDDSNRNDYDGNGGGNVSRSKTLEKDSTSYQHGDSHRRRSSKSRHTERRSSSKHKRSEKSRHDKERKHRKRRSRSRN